MNTRVWVLRDGKRKGPYESRKIIAAFSAGKLRETDRLVWPGQDTPLAPLEAAARLTADTGPQHAARPDYAGFTRRALAWSIDQSIMMATAGLSLFRWFSTEMEMTPDWTLADVATMNVTEWAFLYVMFFFWAFFSHAWTILGLLSAFVFGYYAASEMIVRGTPGKLMVGIRVTTPEGDSIGIRRATARAILRVLLTLCWMPLYATNLLHLFGRRRQTLLDMMTDTVVVRR